LGILRERVVSIAEIFKAMQETKLEIPCRWKGPKQKAILWGEKRGMDIFWNYKMVCYHSLPVKYESTKELASHISSHVSLYVGCKVFLQEKRLGIGGVGCSRLQYQKLYYSLEGFKV